MLTDAGSSTPARHLQTAAGFSTRSIALGSALQALQALRRGAFDTGASKGAPKEPPPAEPVADRPADERQLNVN
ncbi:MAG: hypothetical protein A2201_13255 [Alicyclobacillus sp. RIFOXYA1_FULL_53_8]|nr:MAG: hypothetical protein A2201_13255 [Alicyclobacillus sp. RIFOXYA1_FULL_53_8]